MRIKIVEDLNKELKERKGIYRSLAKGESIKKEPKTLYFTPKSFARTFTPERIRLMLLTKRKKIHSISELAEELGRPFESVHRDVKYLEGISLIKLEKHDKMMQPVTSRISFLF